MAESTTRVRGKLVSASEAAVIAAVHRQTIAKWIGQGLKVHTVGRRGVEHQIDTADLFDFQLARARADALGSADGMSLDEARRVKVQREAELLGYELAKLREETITVEDAGRVMDALIDRANKRLEALPNRLAVLLCPDDTPRARDLIRAVVSEVRDELKRDAATLDDLDDVGGEAGDGEEAP